MLKQILIIIVEAYQKAISPYLGSRCRYFPSCSHYAKEAIGQYGAARGGLMSLRRLLRCHPWGGRGFDPVQ